MMRPHRLAHRALWPLLGLLIAFGFLLALALRPPPEPLDARTAPMEQRK